MTDTKGSGKTDMERVGLFQEMSYITINNKYLSQGNVPFNEAADKGKQMYGPGSKTKSGTQSGYFMNPFSRVFEGEAFTDVVKMRRQHRLKESNKNLARDFIPSNGDKKPSGLGSYYGTIGGSLEAFSYQERPRPKYHPPGKNVQTNPGKMGTGYGYSNVTFARYPKHTSEPYNGLRNRLKKEMVSNKSSMKGGPFKLNMHPEEYFDHNPYRTDKTFPSKKQPVAEKGLKPFWPSQYGKKPGGMHAGTFDPFPTYSHEPYKSKIISRIVGKFSNKAFIPPQELKSTPISSIITKNVSRSVHVNNYKTINSVVGY